ncbi:hypothetical protein Psi02_00040 [Planotetraspora silvatica]|uniref:Uncharacterized protein n=1 Tax=Planotetraspora silvatica TaxID=234614 RepID=A0A8J3XJW0_9ACTN|nr:hypothetical protein [Planotetraspora silvatica]GII43580.1 hypothetical protein Psi02_00040 [Planotetraspora silvatica]
MPATLTRAPDEISARRVRLLQLHQELTLRRCRSRLIRYRRRRWVLKVGRYTVLCAGADGVYAYVTKRGLILSPADQDGIATAVYRLVEGGLG